jgi:hypothetical protein
VIERKKK